MPILNRKSSRAPMTTFFLLCPALPILGFVMVSAGWAQTATSAASSDCKRGKLDCRQNIGWDQSRVNADKEKGPILEDTPEIQDNSYLVEDAYNQEFDRVHIDLTFKRLLNIQD